MSNTAPLWREEYAGGSDAAERLLIDGFTRDILAIQAGNAVKNGAAPDRTLHAKMLVGVLNARLTVAQDLPSDLVTAYFRPGVSLTTAVRFSNASPFHFADSAADMRGAALRVMTGGDEYHDLLMTSYPISHARDARQFIEVAKIASKSKILLVPRLVAAFGLSEAIRIIKNGKSGSKPIASLATQQFWSRAPLLWGEAGPVKYALRPVAPAISGGEDDNCLSVQRYVDAHLTPIEDGAVEWRESDAPFIDVATLTISAQDLGSADARKAASTVAGYAFNPWNCPPEFRPLGGLNRARKRVYLARFHYVDSYLLRAIGFG